MQTVQQIQILRYQGVYLLMLFFLRKMSFLISVKIEKERLPPALSSAFLILSRYTKLNQHLSEFFWIDFRGSAYAEPFSRGHPAPLFNFE
jgi:hypothetical protein